VIQYFADESRDRFLETLADGGRARRATRRSRGSGWSPAASRQSFA